jgi:predicted ATPase
MLTYFQIENFRCFRRLELSPLGRINLIAGKNNSGKTTLLEALFLCAGIAKPDLLRMLNHFRGQTAIGPDAETMFAWNFHRKNTNQPILLVSGNDRQLKTELKVSIGPKEEYGTKSGEKVYSGKALIFEYSDTNQHRAKVVGFPVGDAETGEFEFVSAETMTTVASPEVPIPVGVIFPPFHRDIKEEAKNFGMVIQKRKERDVIQALQVIEPRLQDLRLSYDTLYADLGWEERAPFNYLGDGVHRLFSYLVAILAYPGALLLVDEIENGFHHSVLPGVWRVLCAAVSRSGGQLAATTHSWECIRAANQVFKETKAESVLWRLEERGEERSAVALGQEEVSAFVEMEAEVR